MICPIEIITTFFAKIGLKQKRPSWLISGWVITILYILILFIGIHGFAIHRNPSYMAIYLLLILGLSIFIGAIFEKNTFCRYVCPIGYLLGIYSRLSFLGWRVKKSSVCDSCTDKSCIRKEYQYNLNIKSCGVDLYPAKIDDNNDCILCAGCLKTCSKYRSSNTNDRPNPQLSKIGTAVELFKLKPLKTAELFFVLIVSGFVIYEIWAEWHVSKSLLLYIPKTISSFLSIQNGILSGIIKSTVIFAIVPTFIWVLPFVISKAIGATMKLKDYLLNYGISFIPIMAAAHLSKAVLKTTSRIPYFSHVSDDITGISTAQKIVDNEIILTQNPTTMNLLVSILISALMILGIWLSVRVITRINRKLSVNKSSMVYYLIPVIYGGVFISMIMGWRWL